MKPGTLKPVELIRLAREGMQALEEQCENVDQECRRCPLSVFRCPGKQAVKESWADEIQGALIEMGAYRKAKP